MTVKRRQVSRTWDDAFIRSTPSARIFLARRLSSFQIVFHLLDFLRPRRLVGRNAIPQLFRIDTIPVPQCLSRFQFRITALWCICWNLLQGLLGNVELSLLDGDIDENDECVLRFRFFGPFFYDLL